MLKRSCTFSSGLHDDGDLQDLLKSVQDEHVSFVGEDISAAVQFLFKKSFCHIFYIKA